MIDTRRCRYCLCTLPKGSYRIIWKRNRAVGHECRSELDCLNRIAAQRNDLLAAGREMATACLALSKIEDLHINDRARLERLGGHWKIAERVHDLDRGRA